MLQNKSRQQRYIDLCCGIGGFRIAIENFQKISPNDSFKCVLSADIKSDAIKTYNLNFKEDLKKTDIYSLRPEDIPSFDLLCAGFPCQPFSSAGNKKGFNDTRGGMIFKIVDICKLHRPQTVILENVYNLITLHGGECISKIKDLFQELGYHVNYKKLNSSQFGVPQSRERVYIVCSLNSEIDLNSLENKTKTVLKDIIDLNDKRTNIDETFAKKIMALHQGSPLFGFKMGDKRGGPRNIHSWDIGYNGEISEEQRLLMNKIMLERRKKHWAKKKNIVWMDGMPLTLDEIQTFCDTENLEEMLKDLVQKNYLKLEKCKDLVNGKRAYKEESEEGYNICKGKLSFPISKILNPDDIAPTLTATDSSKLVVIIDDIYIRSLNHTELKKICGFPESFIIPKDVNEYDLFGNMATPPVLTSILELIYQ
jgi:DNA (cytosine-5)-methyltransferase 1